MQLFVDRAIAVQGVFQLDEAGTGPAVASICHRLDGIPLALELAAARLRSLSVAEINQQLDQRFQLLTAGARTAPARHQTLRAMVGWSQPWPLLNPVERALFRRLAVFSGGWTLAAAEQVCSGDGVQEADVLDLLTSLADKSLVLCETPDGTTRYRCSRQCGSLRSKTCGRTTRSRRSAAGISPSSSRSPVKPSRAPPGR